MIKSRKLYGLTAAVVLAVGWPYLCWRAGRIIGGWLAAWTVVYLQLEPVWSRYTNSSGDRYIRGMRVTKMTQSRPARISGVVAVKLRLRIPDGAFMPLRPEVTIDVPDAALDYEPVVTVELPHGGDSDG